MFWLSKMEDTKMMINAMLLAFGLIGIPTVIALHADLAYGEADHACVNSTMPCGAAA